jgi:hypothetical protein
MEILSLFDDLSSFLFMLIFLVQFVEIVILVKNVGVLSKTGANTFKTAHL